MPALQRSEAPTLPGREITLADVWDVLGSLGVNLHDHGQAIVQLQHDIKAIRELLESLVVPDTIPSPPPDNSCGDPT